MVAKEWTLFADFSEALGSNFCVYEMTLNQPLILFVVFDDRIACRRSSQ